MRIDWLWLEEYKNLKDLTINFDEEHLITVLIGRNGTGKSNVLEALTVIFRDLLMEEDGVRLMIIRKSGGAAKETFAMPRTRSVFTVK